jgi:chromosome segregation ATPase
VGELRKLRSDNQSLLDELNGLRQTTPNGMENANLRFEKEALDKKLRKYAAHCQSLGDERVRILHVLQTAKCVAEIDENDIEKAIVLICDKLSLLEQAESRATQEAGKLRLQIATMTQKLRESSELNQKTRQSEDDHRAQLSLLNNKLQEHQNSVAHTRQLEAENVELHDDLKAAKQQSYSLKAEISRLKTEYNLLKDELSMKVASAMRTGEKAHRSRRTPGKSSGDEERVAQQGRLTAGQHDDSTPANKENLPAALSVTKASRSTTTTTTASSHVVPWQMAKVEEAFAPSDENTQECQQS